MEAKAEPWPQFREDPALASLFLAYGEEFGEVCRPDWREADRLARIDKLHAIALRSDGALVGFCLCQIHQELPFKGRRLALASELYVDPLYRGEGTRLLLDEAQRCMRAVGATRFAIHHSMTDPAVLAPLGTGVSMRVWVREL
jgi:GNAT superfamily N-acetyltransferase